MKIFVLLSLLLSVNAFASVADANLLGSGFGAPTINGVANVSNPVEGDIVFDTNAVGFYGYGGTSPGWMA